MSVESYNDYYQLCYTNDSSPVKDEEYKSIIDDEFPYSNYISSPKSYRNKHFCNGNIATYNENIYTDETCPLSPGRVIYSDLSNMTAMLQSSYLSEKLRKNHDTKKAEDSDKHFVEEAVSSLEYLINGDGLGTPAHKEISEGLIDDRISDDNKLPNDNSLDMLNIDDDHSDINNTFNCTSVDDPALLHSIIDPVLLPSEDAHISSTDHEKYFHDEDSSSSGTSSYTHSPSLSCVSSYTPSSSSSCSVSNSNSFLSSNSLFTTPDMNMLSIEINKLKNIQIKHSPDPTKRHSLPKVINDALTVDVNLLEEKSRSLTCYSNYHNSRSSTPSGRKSPFFDIFKSKRSFDSDSLGHCKQKGSKKINKSVSCVTRSNSAFFCNFKKHNLKTVNLMEKQDSENRMDCDINDDMKIQHPSPFVRTIFQYVESTSVEDIFSSSSFNMNDNNNVPVFTCGGMRNLQDSKFNSLSRKYKKNGIIRTMERGQHEPTLVSSGRRVSENSDFYISIVAYLDRIRKAKNASLRRRPRHRRHKSDPGDSISTFLSERTLDDTIQYKQCNNSSDQIAEVSFLGLSSSTIENEKPWTLSKRFSDIHSNVDYKNFKSQFSSSDSAINHRFSLCDDGDNRKSMSRKSRSLKNISSHASKKKCYLMSEQSKRDSLDLNKISKYENCENKESNDNSEDVAIDKQNGKPLNAKRELFPEVEKNLTTRRSVLLENENSQRIPPPRRSVFSENFEMPWPPSLTKSTPNEIKCWLDSQELGPEDRQKLTEQLLLQLIQMGPSECDNNNQSQHISSTLNLISSSNSINESDYFHGDNNISNDNVTSQNHCGINTSDGSQAEQPNVGCSNTKEFNENRFTPGCLGEKQNKTKKIFGSIRRSKSKSVDWNRMPYSNEAYDGDSIKRKPKNSSTKQHHDHQKVKRFSAIRSIFEPITSPKSKKGWKSPMSGKLDRNKIHSHLYNNKNNINGTRNIDSGFDNDEDKNEGSKVPFITVKSNGDCLSPMELEHEKHISNCDSEEKDIEKENSSINSSSENCFSSTENSSENLNGHIEKKLSYMSCERNIDSKLVQKAKSTDSIPEEIKSHEMHRRVYSRSVDAIQELKKHSSFAAALFQDINDSGILHGTGSMENDVKRNSPDIIEVYIANNFVKSSEEFEKENDVMEEVTSSEPNLNWSNKGGCNHCNISNKDVENSRIVVDVPHHLIPPEIASKSPIQSPNVRRKGLLKKTPCLLQHSLSHGERAEKGSDFNSADSGLSLTDETDYSQQQFEKDITNFSLITESKHSVTVNVEPTKHSDESHVTNKSTQYNHTRKNSHKTEILHRVDRVSVDNKNLPHIITFNRDHLPETITNKNGSQPKPKPKLISPILSKDFSFNSFNNSTSEGCAINTVQRHTSYSVSNHNNSENNKIEVEVKSPSSTVSVARVLPFNKSDSHESPDEAVPSDDVFESQNDNNCGEIQLTRKPSVIWAIVKKMEVSLVIQRDYGDPEIIKIEDFNVRRVNNYKDVEELAVDTYMKHLQLLDKQHLDLDTYDIKYLQMAEQKVPIGSPFDLSLVKIEDSFLPCRLCMKDKESWSLASLSYESLIPKSYLEKYVSLILSHHHVIFFGPSGTGKSYLAERIANLINYRMNEDTIPPIILKNATPERWRTLLTNLCAEKREKPFVIILDGFSQRFIDSDIDIHDIIKVCEDKHPKPFIICTLTITPNIEIPPKWQLNFRWIWLSNHEEPIDGLLQRYLRRKFIQYGNQHLQRESFRIADWLTTVWRHINTFISKFTSTDCSIGPTMFYDCPSDILEAEEWFVDLWNYSVTPYILHSVKQGLKSHGVRCDWEDPLAYILKSYPWVSEKVKKKMKLKRICREDVDYSLHCHSEEEKQRLLDFLRQLEVMMFEKNDQGNDLSSKGYRKESSL